MSVSLLASCSSPSCVMPSRRKLPASGRLENFSVLVQISAASEKQRIRRYLTERKGLPSKRRARWYR
jgi:hypothetical protein